MILRHVVIVLMACGLINTPLFAQIKLRQERIDSLLAVLPSLKNDTNRIATLNDLSFTASTIGEADKGIKWGNLALLIAKKISFKKGEAAAYNYLGVNYWVKHDYLTEQKYLLQALNINQKLSDTAEIAKTLRNIGNIYETEYNYAKALDYYQRALRFANNIHNIPDAMAYNACIANIYDIQKNYPKALEFYQQYINLCIQIYSQAPLGGIFRRMGLVYANQGKYAKALEYEKKGLAINESLRSDISFKNQYKWSVRAMGIVYFQQGSYQESLPYFKSAYKEFKLSPDAYSMDGAGICLSKLGCAYLKMAQQTNAKSKSYNNILKNAEKAFTQAIDLLKPHDWTSLAETLQNLSIVYQLLGNYKDALATYREFSIYKDSLNNTEIEKKVIIQEMEYEHGRQKDSMVRANILQSTQLKFFVQQKELDALKSKQQRVYVILIFIIICVVASYFLYRNYLAKKDLKNELYNERIAKQLQFAEHERNISRTTLTALVAQMNPHFLFNALNTIQSFIYSNDKKNASNYLGKFSVLTRKILDNSNKINISLNEEIALLRLYLDIEKVRFGDNFIASINVDESLDDEAIFFPPMLIQPYVENAIKNGLLHILGKKELVINICKIDEVNGVKIIIDDNGIGREKSLEINSLKIGHHSFANNANQKRIDLINQTLDKKILLEIIDKKNEKGFGIGTTVIITIPSIL